MKKGYKECPFCSNEIKEGAKKCQYCHEFVDDNEIGGNKEANNMDVNDRSENTENKIRPWYKNIGTWVVAGFLLLVIIYNISLKVEQKQAKEKVDSYYDTIIEKNGDVSDVDFNEYINASKTAFNNRTADKFLDQLQVILNDYDKSLNSIGDLFIEENNDLKDTSKLREVISNWEKYKTAHNKYEADVLKLSKDAEGELGKTNKLNDAAIRISELVKSINRWSDVNIELYKYILNIQDDFYVDYDDEIYFYEGTNSMDKFNTLREEWGEESEIFDEAYNSYINFMVEFAENAKNGNNKSDKNMQNINTSNNTTTYNITNNNTTTQNNNGEQDCKDKAKNIANSFRGSGLEDMYIKYDDAAGGLCNIGYSTIIGDTREFNILLNGKNVYNCKEKAGKGIMDFHCTTEFNQLVKDYGMTYYRY